MENTAHKLSSEQVVKDFKEAHGNLDLLRVYMVTGSADIGRSYELVTRWLKNSSSEADRARFRIALKTLEEIELKRIETTALVYNATPETIEAINTTDEAETTKVVMMLPKLEDILERVKAAYSENEDKVTANKIAFELLKTSVGQNKAVSATGETVTWDNNKINEYLDTIEKEVSPEVIDPIIQEGENFGFETIYNHLTELIGFGKTEEEVKAALKEMLLHKIIIDTKNENNFLIKDEAVYEDYYGRMLDSIVKIGIEAKNKQAAEATTTLSKEELVEKKIQEEVIPILEELDKNEDERSLVSVTKKIRDIYSNSKLSADLRSSMFKAKELAEKYAPNLFKRNTETNKDNVPLTPATTIESKDAVAEIYDESHNIAESNKELWAEVENYEYLNQIFEKGMELTKAEKWRDAISMAVILISSGKIKETESSETTLSWDTDQIKLWVFSNIINVIDSELDKDKGIVDAVIVEETTVVEETTTTEEAKTVVVQGPVPAKGFTKTETKEPVTRLLKDAHLWKDKYSFKSFSVPTDSHKGSEMFFEVVDATVEEEKDLLATEHQMAKFIDDQQNLLIETPNNFPKVKKNIVERLSAFYEITNSEANRITAALRKEADVLRKQERQAKQELSNENKEGTDSPPVENPVETQVTETAVEPTVELTTESTVEQTSSEENDSNEETSVTESTAGENSTNGNEKVDDEKVDYAGFEKILKASKKLDAHKAIFEKVKEYPNNEDGIKAVFDKINTARKDHRYKKSFIRNWKPTPAIDLLNILNKVVSNGEEVTKVQ